MNKNNIFLILQYELGFDPGGYTYSIPEFRRKIQVIGQRGTDVNIHLLGYVNTDYFPNSYRIPIIAKEVFKLYFAEDADRVFGYMQEGFVPDEFEANGFDVTFASNHGVNAFRLRNKKD